MLAINRFPRRMFFFGIFFLYYKNLHMEPFNYTIKSVCFDFGSTNVGSLVIKTGRSEGYLLPYFYRFWCHYPLITYLSSRNRNRNLKNARKKIKELRHGSWMHDSCYFWTIYFRTLQNIQNSFQKSYWNLNFVRILILNQNLFKFDPFYSKL